MSDVAEEVAAPAPAPAPAAEAVAMDVPTALRRVLNKALVHDGLKRGLRETVRALDRRTARVCCLAQNCDQPDYVRLVRALCDENEIPLVMVESNLQLGEWCGLAKMDGETVTKVVKCSSCAVTDFGEDSSALNVLLAHLKTSK